MILILVYGMFYVSLCWIQLSSFPRQPFPQEYPEYVAYSTPLFFKDDWLNLYLDDYHLHSDPDYQEQNEVSCSDYRFVYMGPKGWSLVQ